MTKGISKEGRKRIGKICKADICRQKEIETELGCKFVRIKVQLRAVYAKIVKDWRHRYAHYNKSSMFSNGCDIDSNLFVVSL